MATENSVVASLNEVRRLERERVRREDEARMRREAEERARREAELAAREEARRTGGAYSAGYAETRAPNGVNMNGWGGRDAHEGAHGRHPMRTHELPAFDPGTPYGAAYGVPPEAFRSAPEIRTRTSWTGLFLLTAAFLVAGFVGYFKLEQDVQNRLLAVERKRLSAEDARDAALEERDRAERLAKDRIAELEAKLARLGAEQERTAKALEVAATPTVPTAAEPARVTKPSKRAAKLRASAKGDKRARAALSKREEARAAAETETPAPKPKLKLKKGTLSDDPLSGIKL